MRKTDGTRRRNVTGLSALLVMLSTLVVAAAGGYGFIGWDGEKWYGWKDYASKSYPVDPATYYNLPGEVVSLADSPDGSEEAQVHGHWVIQVRNADGTLVSHREFDNPLAPGGQGSLAKVLSKRSL